jgi:ATP/maltotriose-dependent transcriptional regulator MalT/DNA-binding SARP family transcriptional activator
MVWLAAPPGAGKTTLVATYLQAAHVPVVWYQVDTGDADPAGFFYYLGVAAADLCPKARFPLLASEHRSDLADFSRRFFRYLFSQLPAGVVLVLDNFQEAADSGLSVIVRDACAEIPPGMNLVVISRCEPSLAFVELEARAGSSILAWSELRFTLDEMRAMAAVKGVTDEWLVRALHQESDGWAAGARLMLERLRRAGGDGRSLPTETRESVFNYFAALIFDQAPESTRRTLLALAFLPRVTPSMAQALTGSADAPKLLENLRRRHLFIDRRPGPEPVYQFHALFAAFLRARAFELLSPEAAREQLRAAGEALDSHGEWEAGLDLFVEAQAWDRASALIVAHASTLLSTGRWQTLVQWIEALPEHLRDGEAWLNYWLASAQAQTDPVRATVTFERAHTQFAERGEDTGRVLSLAGLLHAYSVDHTDYRVADRWLDTLADRLAARPPSLMPDQEITAWGALLFCALFVRPWHPCIGLGLARVEALLGSVEQTDAALRAATSALTVASQSCQMDRCEALSSAVRSLASKPDVSPVLAAWGLFQLAHQQFMRAEYEASVRCFEEVWALAEANGLKRVLTASLSHRFMIDFRLRDRAAAESAMRKIETLPLPTHPLSQGLLACYQARLAQVREEPQVAADLAERSHAAILQTGAGFHEMIFGLINGEILLGAGRVAEARLLIERSRAVIEQSAILATLYPSLLLVESWLAQQEGRLEDGLRLLREALKGSRWSYGWCQMRYVDTTCAHMLRVALERGIEPDAARRLIKIFRLKPRETDTEAWPWPVRVYVLGRLEVVAGGAVLEFERKAPKKALALLKALIVLGPREVAEEPLVDALWPDEEGDAGHKALSVTVLRLRRLLGDNDLVRQQGGKLSIDRQRCWVDAWAFERRLVQPCVNAAATGEELRELERALSLYGGVLLPEDTDEPWTVPTRERLRAKFIHGLASLGKHLESWARHDEAITWYLKGLDADPVVEAFYQGLMRCYSNLDRRTEAIGAYRRLKHTLSVTLGLPPSGTTERLYQSLRAP